MLTSVWIRLGLAGGGIPRDTFKADLRLSGEPGPIGIPLSAISRGFFGVSMTENN